MDLPAPGTSVLPEPRADEASGRALLRCYAALALASDPDALVDAFLAELAAWLDVRSAWAVKTAEDGMTRVSACSDAAWSGLAWRVQAPPGTCVLLHDVAGPDGATHAAVLLLRLGDPAAGVAVACAGDGASFPTGRMTVARELAAVADEALARATEHARLRIGLAGRLRAESAAMRRQTDAVHAHKMDAVAQLAAGMAHEVNSPLQFASDNLRFLSGAMLAVGGAVGTMTEWLRPHIDPERLRTFIDAADLDFLREEGPRAAEQCREGLDRVAAIVETLRRFGSDNAASPSPADINEAIRNTLAICAGTLPEGITVRLALGELPPVTCRIAEIRQVVASIVRNAVQAITDRGGIGGTIAVSTIAGQAEVEIAVEDDGCGMEADILARACEPFFTTREVGRGTGQGLAIAHEVVRSHGGRLELTSEPGCGTRVGVLLPVAGPVPLSAHPG